MATYHAVSTVSLSILRLLEDAYPRAEFGPLTFELYQVNNFQKPMALGFSLFLYRIGVNRTRRTTPQRPDALGRRPAKPLGVDLNYLLTAWAQSAEKQQLLLAWAMRVLEDNAILPSGLLNDNAPRPSIFAADESVELLADSLSLQDVYPLWELLKPYIPLSATYVARLIDIESVRFDAEFAPVQTVAFDFAKVPTP
jgi:hypothetical protein